MSTHIPAFFRIVPHFTEWLTFLSDLNDYLYCYYGTHSPKLISVS